MHKKHTLGRTLLSTCGVCVLIVLEHHCLDFLYVWSKDLPIESTEITKTILYSSRQDLKTNLLPCIKFKSRKYSIYLQIMLNLWIKLYSESLVYKANKPNLRSKKSFTSFPKTQFYNQYYIFPLTWN